MKNQKALFFENLDAIRGIAFSLVFFYHFYGYLGYSTSNYFESVIYHSIIMEGHLGVNLFFVLSGFLITYLLIVEKENTGKINVLFFYMRRVLRIWPIYFIMLFIGFIIFPLLTHQLHLIDLKEHLLFYISFLHNFDRIHTQFVGVGNDNLGVLWSIAVEEQFYLLWPLLLFIINKKHYLKLFFAVIAASLIFRFVNSNNPTVLYLHTFSVMSDLAVGGLLAYFSFYKTWLFFRIENCKKSVVVILYLFLFFAILFFQKWSHLNTLTLVIERLVLAILFAFVIAEQCFCKNSFYKLGKLKWLSWLGLISYGLYCMHLYSIVVVQSFNTRMGFIQLPKTIFYAELLFCFVLSCFIAYLSYHFFEKRILRLKSKFMPLITS